MKQQAPPTDGRHDRVLDFAVQELRRYVTVLSGAGAAERVVREGRSAPGGAVGGLRVGTFRDFGAAAGPWPAVADPALDDAVFVQTRGATGVIAGSNPRSTLLAVYRYLWELGCRWVRPGADGEVVPRIELGATTVRLCEAPSYRHRGICIDGAVSYEHVRDIIDWAPKLGFNAYFMQFREGFTFFERWYSHRGNPLKEPEPFSVEQARRFKAGLVGEMEQRGLLFHDVGHGWTCEPLGLPGLGWEYEAPPVPPDVTPFLAEMGGERALFRGVPLNTNLCYSNPRVRALVVEDVVAYCAAHPEVDFIHFWLADNKNNHCECAECRRARPADWYVRMLNDLDARLTTAGQDVRVVFLVYNDLLWPPQSERIARPERFVLMFAPIQRTYSRAYGRAYGQAPAGGEAPPALPPYERNRLTFTRSPEGNVAFLRAWQSLFAGDSFDFEFHLWHDHYRDPGYVGVAEVAYGDIRSLTGLGLNGLVSAQTQRSFFPTGLPMVVMGRTLWQSDGDFEALAGDYFGAAFGDDGGACLAYCRELSRLFDPPYLRGEKPRIDPDAAASLSRIPSVVERFRLTIRRNLDATAAAGDACRARSWRYLEVHADVCLGLATALRHRSMGEDDAARADWLAVLRLVQEREDDAHPALDVYKFGRVLGGLFRAPQGG